MKNNTLSYRMEQVEKRVNSLDKKIDLILQNHLPHINTEIASLVTSIRITTALNVGAIIIGLILSKYLL